MAGGVGAGGEVEAEGAVGKELQAVHAAVLRPGLGIAAENQRQGQVAAAVAGPGLQGRQGGEQGGVAAHVPAGAAGGGLRLPEGSGEEPRQALPAVAGSGCGQGRTEPRAEGVKVGHAEGQGDAPGRTEEVGQHRDPVAGRPFEAERRTAPRPLADPVGDRGDLQPGIDAGRDPPQLAGVLQQRQQGADIGRRRHGFASPHPPPPGVAMVSRSPGRAWKLHLPGSSRTSPSRSRRLRPQPPGPPPASP